jgi:hypothetical protein
MQPIQLGMEMDSQILQIDELEAIQIQMGMHERIGINEPEMQSNQINEQIVQFDEPEGQQIQVEIDHQIDQPQVNQIQMGMCEQIVMVI